MSPRTSLYLIVEEPGKPRRLVQASFAPFAIGTHESADLRIASKRPVRLVIDHHGEGYAVSVFPLAEVPRPSRVVELRSGVFLNVGGVRLRFLCSPVPEHLKSELLGTPMEVLERQRDLLEEPLHLPRRRALGYTPRHAVLPPPRRPSAPPRDPRSVDPDAAITRLERLLEEIDQLSTR